MNPNFNIDNSLIERLVAPDSTTTVSTMDNQAIIDPARGNGLIIAITTRHTDFNEDEAFTALAIILQKGGTSKRAQGDIYAIVNNKRLTLRQIRDIMEAIRTNFTLRQWARTYATLIQQVSSHFGIEGDLAKKFRRESPELVSELSRNDFFWLSNFQQDNPNCPENVRKLIRKHFNDKFPSQTK